MPKHHLTSNETPVIPDGPWGPIPPGSPAGPVSPLIPCSPWGPCSPLILVGLDQLPFKVLSELTLATIIHIYSPVERIGGSTVQPDGSLVVTVTEGALVEDWFLANLNSIEMPSLPFLPSVPLLPFVPLVPLTCNTSDHSVTSLVNPLTVPMHCHQVPLIDVG